MKLRTTLVLLSLLTFFAGSALAQPRAYLPSLNDGTVTVMDVSTNTIIDVINVGDRANSAVVTPDGTKVYVTRNPTGGRVEVIQTSTNTVIDTINVGGSPSDVAITPDGTRAYVSSFSGNIHVIDTATDTEIDTIPVPGLNTGAGHIRVTPDGAFAYVLIENVNQRLLRIDTSTNTFVGGGISSFGNGTYMDISPSGDKLYITVRSGGVDGVQIIDIDMAGVPSAGAFVSLQLGDCELEPNAVAVHPITNEAWVVTTPTALPFLTCGPANPFHAELVIIRPNDTSFLITNIMNPPAPFGRLGFTRNGSDVLFTTFMSRSVTSPAAMFPVMPGMDTLIDPSFPASPYFIGPSLNDLSVTKTGDGDGNITSTNPAGMNCDSTASEICEIPVPTGLEVTLTATADASSIFNGWGGDCSGAGTSTMITVNADANCTADFETQQFNVDVSINPAGGGSVTSSPSGINCPGTCSQLFDINTFINLTETPDPDFNFINWTGDADCGDGDIDDLMEDTSCIANFAIKRFTVTVNIEGDGTGSVVSTPSGINCPGDCSEEYDIHTMVTLNETTNPDSDFLGWTGPADCTDGIIQDLTEDITCTATFNLKRFTLNITKSGAGDGTITSVPVGIDCGSDCDEVYIIGTEVDLTALADPVSIFTGFTGHADCVDGMVTMLSDITCNANFDFLPLILNPIFPGIASNINEISAEVTTPGGPVAFLWGLQPGATTIGGPTCNGITIDIKNPQLLSITNAGQDQIAIHAFYIPLIGDFDFPVLTQSVDIPTCRVSELEVNIIRKQ